MTTKTILHCTPCVCFRAGENKEIKGVQVSTVDAFQGGERDIIILSTVRTHASGFIDNDK